MKWENLRQFKCPHCGEGLAKDSEAREMRCTSCRFRIEYFRFKQIAEHRGESSPVHKVSIKWQYLHLGKCPICTNDLYPGNGAYNVLKCIQADCSFHIREDRLAEIIADDEHPVNRFKHRLYDRV